MRLFFLAAVVPFLAPPAAQGDDRVSFSRDIRPLLSDKCFLCHGPSEETRATELRLDVRESAIGFGAVAPGNPNKSEILARIRSTDPDLVMPPPETGKAVTADEQELLARWITDDAVYESHYAFQTPSRPELPQPIESQWAKNPIDTFVLAKLEDEALSPSAAADRVSLIRRLSLDLTGLPPSIQEVDDYLADESENATEKVIDRLLSSPHFGERWARWWLDAARYADSDGYEKDKPREVWFYRDYVIDAMNRNKPYDAFVIEQLAGDLLPNASQDQLVATGFLRNSMVNEEGGADPEQFRVEGMFDRMDAIGKSILGITTQCAQCHTHKYDPLTHREYYEMFAALNDFHEATMSVFTEDQAVERDALLRQITNLEDGLKARNPDWQARMSAWEHAALARQPDWQIVEPTDRPFEGQKFRPLPDGSIISESYAPTKNSATFRLTTPINGITAFRLEALTHPQLPRSGPGRSVDGTGALTEFKAAVAAVDSSKTTDIKWSRAYAEINPPETPLRAPYLNKDPSKDKRVTGSIAFAIDNDANTAWTTDIDPGRRNTNRQAVFVAKEPAYVEGAEQIRLAITLDQKHGGWNSDDNQNYLLGRYRFSVTTDDVSDFEIVPLDVLPLLGKPYSSRTETENKLVFAHWRTTVDEFAETNSQIEKLWTSFPETASQLVAQSLGTTRPTHILTRGEFLSPGESVQPNVPAFLHDWPESDEPARLRFARWIAADNAPTTARAIVNRIWQAYFGQGLVVTPEDLGFQSPPPSHPELLDWLAVELVESGWSLKHIHRLIVTSAVYQQAARITPQSLERDQYNVLLSRGPRFRVDAEIVRDIALSVSGLLDTSIGGPSVYPEAPRFLFLPPASYGPKQWPVSTDGQQFRRSLYVHQYRSVPYPTLQVFDAPKGDAACTRRGRSNTPLQALVVLNEPQFVFCAQRFAARICDEAASDHDRIVRAFRLALSRKPTKLEEDVLLDLLGQQRKRLSAGELDAHAITGDPDAHEDLAAWVAVARAVLNLDETITKP